MKKLVAGIVVILSIWIVLAYWERSGDEIKIFAFGRDVQAVIDQMNYMVPQKSITFRLVQNEDDADVSIRFQDDIGISNVDAVAFTHRGQIYIANTAPTDSLPSTFLHEILHCAGVKHEEDPSSVMYVYTHNHGELNSQQLRDLKRLSGITPPERLIAQLRLLL